MNKKKIKEFILKYIILSLIIQFLFTGYAYYSSQVFVPFGSHDIIIFLFILFMVSMFWAFLWYLQDTVGIVMKESIGGKIVFVLIALGVIYMYKASGKI